MALLTKPSTRLARLATATILAFAGSGYAVAPAHTQEQTLVAPRHTAVLSIVPADGAVLDRAPREIVLTFNEKISPQYAQLILSRDGTALSIAEPVVTGEVIRVPLEQGIGTFTACQAKGIESKYLWFPDENHWVPTDTRFPGRATTRSGVRSRRRPRRRLQRRRRPLPAPSRARRARRLPARGSRPSRRPTTSPASSSAGGSSLSPLLCSGGTVAGVRPVPEARSWREGSDL